MTARLPFVRLNYSFILIYIQFLPITWQSSLRRFVLRRISCRACRSARFGLRGTFWLKHPAHHIPSPPTHSFFSPGSLSGLRAVSDGMLFMEIGACQASLGLDVSGWRVSLCSLITSSLVQHACAHSGPSQNKLFPGSPHGGQRCEKDLKRFWRGTICCEPNSPSRPAFSGHSYCNYLTGAFR